MNKAVFKSLVYRYRCFADGAAESAGWTSADWISDVWLNGSLQCLEVLANRVAAGSRILDFGCGVGFMTVLLKAMGYDAEGIDIDIGSRPGVSEDAFSAPWGTRQLERSNPGFVQGFWQKSREMFGVRFQSFDGLNIPFPDSSFDAVMAHAVIEHVRPDILPLVIREIRRVLKEDGTLLVFRTPRKDAYLEKLFRLRFLHRYAHQILYNESELRSMVTGEGLSVIYEGLTDMLPAFPPRGMRFYNSISPLLTRLDALLLRTPLKKYAHHLAMVFQREQV